MKFNLLMVNFFINGKKIEREKINILEPIRCGIFILNTKTFIETLP